MKKPLIKVQSCQSMHQKTSNSRRKFLKVGGLAMAGSSLLLYSCSEDDDTMPPDPDPDPDPNPEPPVEEAFDLGSGDVGILNYAYALEQLEAQFYMNVLDSAFFTSASPEIKLIFEDLYAHEVIHRELFKEAIGAAVDDASQVLPDLEFDFNSVDFTSAASVLGTAQLLEDTGVQAYNGAGHLLTNPTYLLLAGKIVSVEARHAAAIRDLNSEDPQAFASDDILISLGDTGMAYDKATPPADIIAAVGDTNFITTEFTANNLPTG